MAQQALVPIFGFGTKGKSANVTAQRRINLYLEQGDDKSQLALYSRPGLIAACQNATTAYLNNDYPNAIFGQGARGCVVLPIGGYYWSGNNLVPSTYSDVVVGVSGNTTFGIMSSSSIFRLGLWSNPLANIETNSGPVAFGISTLTPVDASSGLYEVVMVDGKSIYALQVFAQSGQASVTNLRYAGAAYLSMPYGATSACSIAGRIVVNDPSSPGRFRWSPVGWTYYLTGTGWDPLDYATAESSADPLPAVWEVNGDLVLWGTSSTEFWSPTGGDDVFARIGGSGIQWGIAAVQSLAKFGGGTIFLGRNAGGNRQVGILTGYQVRVVSTPDVDYDINKDPQPNQATGYVATVDGHSSYVLNLSQKTWVFDLTTEAWSEWQTEGGRFAGQFGVPANGDVLVNDYRNLKWYVMAQDVYKDGDAPIVREIQTKHVAANNDRLSASELAVEFEYGTGLNSGQGSDPQVMLQVSRDNGHTWGAELWRSLGTMGQYAKRVFWTRLGRSRDFVFRLRIADPVKVVIVNAYMRLSK